MPFLTKKFWPATLREVVEIVGAIGLVGSAVFSAYQYSISRADRHVEQTFKFLERFEGERLETAQRTIDQLAAKAGQNADRMVAGAATPELSTVERDTMRNRVFVETVMASNETKNGDVPSAMLDVTSFFNGLEVCIEQQLCDGNIAHAFLDVYSTSFWREFATVVKYSRATRRPQFAAGMERFVHRARESDR